MKLKLPLGAALLLLLSSICYAQQDSYYVVIGGFANEVNAQKFVDRALELNFPATYALNPERNIYYVYVRATGNKGNAYAILKRMQEEDFRDAWVFKGSLDGAHLASAVKREPVNEPVIRPEKTEPVAENINPEEAPRDTVTQVTEPPKDPLPAEVKPAGKAIVFKLVNRDNGNPVTGEVHLLESERANQYRGYKGNEKVYVVPPANASGRWFVACTVIGFQPYGRIVGYANAEQLKDATLGPDQEVIIPLELSRVTKGDYIEMDNVRFFENSNIFKPESERELSELVAMMQEGLGYKIKLHGHTNGDHVREIISRTGDQNFFEVDPGNNRHEGTAKELSTLRAETVKSYLVGKGVDASRISTKGEGGKQPIFDPKGTAAASNARVEVEIVKH
jgi:outer membrane protein OmpA-like peptidoglycan-associated protein